jgi:hypothetical protein
MAIQWTWIANQTRGLAIDGVTVPERILKGISTRIDLPSRFPDGRAGTDKRIE